MEELVCNMKFRHRPRMLFCCLVALCLWTHGASAAPATKSLEQTPSDLTWDAWLKQEHQPDDIPPRRITTKSLFVFPNLGADSLPACADGYRPDSMGRCVKNVKINETAHLEFLLQKLNSQFAPFSPGTNSDEMYDYDAEVDTSDGPGPFQVNIPLALSHSGQKNDNNEPGEYVHISKKKPQDSPPEMSPEASPNNQFFPNGPPAENQNVVFPSNSSAAEGLPVLVASPTNTGLTILIPSNGKIENVVDEKGGAYATDSDSDGPANADAKNPSPSQLGQGDEKTSEVIQNGHSEPPSFTKKDDLLEQIEALKIYPEVIVEPSPNPQHHHFDSSKHRPVGADNDIEEKIKIISQFADVSRNTESSHVFPHKKPSSNFVRFPTDPYNGNTGKPQDLLPDASVAVQMPVNTNSMPMSQNTAYNVYPIDNFENFQPINYKNEDKYKPYWLPYGWDTYRAPNGEHNLIDFWHKVSTAQRYPQNVRFRQELKPTQYPSLYPSFQKAGSRINLGHTTVNYRQGREDNTRRHGPYQDDSMNYKRSFHPLLKGGR